MPPPTETDRITLEEVSLVLKIKAFAKIKERYVIINFLLRTTPYKSASRYVGVINIHFHKNSWIVGSCWHRFVVQMFTGAFHLYTCEITSSLIFALKTRIELHESSFIDAIIESRGVIAPVACGYCVQSVVKALQKQDV